MRLLLLLRHAVTEHTGARLSGWMPGLHLSEEGRRQADGLAGRLGPGPRDAPYASPLERCQETAAAVAEAKGLKLQTLEDVIEVRYGDWTGRTLKELAKEPLWKVVQATPSAARFPDGESIFEMQGRSGLAIERLGQGPPPPPGGGAAAPPRRRHQGDPLPLPGDAPRPGPAPGGQPGQRDRDHLRPGALPGAAERHRRQRRPGPAQAGQATQARGGGRCPAVTSTRGPGDREST